MANVCLLVMRGKQNSIGSYRTVKFSYGIYVGLRSVTSYTQNAVNFTVF